MSDNFNGGKRYHDILRDMEPEEREAYLQDKADKREMKKLMAGIFEEQATEITDKLMQAAHAALNSAIESGNAQAFMFLYNTLIGKPITEIDVKTNGQALTMTVVTSEELEEPAVQDTEGHEDDDGSEGDESSEGAGKDTNNK